MGCHIYKSIVAQGSKFFFYIDLNGKENINMLVILGMVE